MKKSIRKSNNPSEITVYGTSWCPDCRQAKQFLGELRLPYKWVDIEKDSRGMKTVERLNEGKRRVPTIVLADGIVLVNPDNAELAEKLGLKMKASRKFYDVIIIGGGPAGLTAGVYTAREGLDTLLIESAGLGGQAGITNQLDNFPGFDQGIKGSEFADRLTRQAKRFGVEILQAQRVETIISDRGGYRVIKTAAGQEYHTKAVIIATGSQYRRLNIPGETELIGVNIHFCATCDGAFYKDKKVLVVGGGNSSFEEGLFLTKFASQVTIISHSPEIKASKILQEKVAEKSDVMKVITNYDTKEFLVKEGHLAGVKVLNKNNNQVEILQPDGVFVFIGMSANSAWLPAEIKIDQRGFIVTEHDLMSSMAGVFVAGDVRQGSTKQAASAVGEGATAALMARQYLERM